MNLQEIAALPLRAMSPRQLARVVRFFCYVDAEGPESCWLWTGGRVEGYGAFNGSLSHIFAFTTLCGDIPKGMTLDHLCCNRPCVNPNHLEPVPRSENSKRVWIRGRGYNPNLNKTVCKWGHKFTPENTLYRPNGARRCKACTQARTKRVNQEHPEKLQKLREYGNEWRAKNPAKVRAYYRTRYAKMKKS